MSLTSLYINIAGCTEVAITHHTVLHLSRPLTMLFSTASRTVAVLALAIGALAIDKTVDPSLDANLKTAATSLDKLGLLASKNGNGSWLLDFTKSSYYTFAPGGS